MIPEHFYYLSADGQTQIHAIEWKAEKPPVGILQIAHGMQEFIDRYHDFAVYMAELGFIVVGNDHLGHGASVRTPEYYGYFAEKAGNRCVIADMRALQRRTQEKYPDLPYFLLGHSMGSFLARQYACQYGKSLTGVVISGTAYHPLAEVRTGMWLCRVLAGRYGWMHRSRLMTRISMGSFNKRFEPARTKVDWLTRDEAVVDAYRMDTRTQFTFTLNAYYNMFAGLKTLTDSHFLHRLPRSLPMLFIAGEMDPVGGFGEGVKKTALQLQNMGMTHITCRLYPNDRHEVLNELDRKDVYKDVSDFLTGCLEGEADGKNL